MVDRQLSGVAGAAAMRQSSPMVADSLRAKVRSARDRNSRVVRVLDAVRALGRADGRALLWTRFAHGAALHQTSGTSWPERYPELFDLAAELAPEAQRILSFGCSSGEELDALRRRFANAEIVGAEINPRLRKAARARIASDGNAHVLAPDAVDGAYDLVFALSVLQRLPEQVARRGLTDLSKSYPFERFDSEVARLAGRLRPGALLCIMNAHYRVEDSSCATLFRPVPHSPAMTHPLFGRDSRRLPPDAVARSIFRKL
jgi:hypothetical protein